MTEKIPCFIMLHGYKRVTYPVMYGERQKKETILVRANRISCITPITSYEAPKGASSLEELQEVVNGSWVELIDTETGYMGAQEHIAFICRETPEEIMNMLMAEENSEDAEV